MAPPQFNAATGRWELPDEHPPRDPAGPRAHSAHARDAREVVAPGFPARSGPPAPTAPRSPGVPPVPRPVPLTGAGPRRSRRTSRAPWIAAVVVAFLAGLAIPTDGATGTVTEAASDERVGGLLDTPSFYAFEITTAGTDRIGEVSWSDGRGEVASWSDRAAPFGGSVTVPGDRPWTTVRVTARLPADAGTRASITCTMTDARGRVVDTATRSDPEAEATCRSADR